MLCMKGELLSFFVSYKSEAEGYSPGDLSPG